MLDLRVELARARGELELALIERAGTSGQVVVAATVSRDDVGFPLSHHLLARFELSAGAGELRLACRDHGLAVAEHLLESAHRFDLLASLAESTGLRRRLLLQLLDPGAERAVSLRELQLSRVELMRARQ